MTILVVDDSSVHRTMLAAMLRGAGHQQVLLAESAEDAFRQLGMYGSGEAVSPEVDLIMMDILMSPIDGIEACGRITSSERARHIPVVMVSALDNEAKLSLAFSVGAVDYVTKPIRQFELLARVGHLLRLKRETDCRSAREHELVEKSRELNAANLALQHLSMQDGLTGVANRRRLDEYLELEWRRAIRNRSTLSVIMIDIDHFKNYNDSYGHGAGDAALSRVAASLTGSLRRAADLVVRFGGEEFAIVLPETSFEHAMVVAETVRRGVERLAIEHGQSPVSGVVTISAGVASTVPDRHSSVANLLRHADQELYASKGAGRNRVSGSQHAVSPAPEADRAS